MEQTVILKKYIKQDQSWEIRPHLTAAGYLMVYLMLFFGGMVALAVLMVPGILMALYLIGVTIAAVTIMVKRNLESNGTRYMTFIKRGPVLYRIQMAYIPDCRSVEDPIDASAFGWGNGPAFTAATQLPAEEATIRETCQKATLYVRDLDAYLATGTLPRYVLQISVMNNPVIEKETESAVWISYEGDSGRSTKKIRNVYDFSCLRRAEPI